MRETEAEVYVNEDDDGGGSRSGGDGRSGKGSGGCGAGAGDSSDDDDEEERKLSTVQELSELNADTASPPLSLAMCQACERSQGEPRRDSDQVTDFPRFR